MKRGQTFGNDNEEEDKQTLNVLIFSLLLTSTFCHPLYGSPSVDENFVVKKEYNGKDVNPNIYADYLKLNERYTDLETKYSEAMDRLTGLEQTKYEDDEFISHATEERDQAKKGADDALQKMKDIELVNKNLRVDLANAQEANETMKSQINEMEEKIKGFEAERIQSGTAVKGEDDIAALKLQYDTLKNDYDMKIKEHVEYRKSIEKLLENCEKERNDELERASQAAGKAEKLESELMNLQATINKKNDEIVKMKEKQIADEKISKEKQTEQSAKMEYLQKQLSEITVAVKSEDDKIAKLKAALDSSKQQLEDQKSTAAQQSAEAITAADVHISRINDLLASAKTKEDEIIQLQKQLAESAHRHSSQIAKTIEANGKVRNLVEKISDYCRIVKEKDQQISDLTKKVAMQEKEIEDVSAKAEESSRSFEKELKEARAEVLMMQEKLSKLQNELNNLQTQTENERTSAAQERQTYTEEFEALKTSRENIVAKSVKIKVEKEQLEKELKEANTMHTMAKERISKLQDEFTVLLIQLDDEKETAAEREAYIEQFENIKTSYENIAAENVKTNAEKEKVEQEIIDLRNASNAKIFELEASILGRAKEMFNEWKKKEKNVKVKKEPRETTVAAAAVNVKEQMNDMDDTVMENDQPQQSYQPKWIISNAECFDIYTSNKNKISNFLQQYTSRLFNTAELMLPEEKQNHEKWNEAVAIIFYFWKPENDAQKELCVGALKKKMKERRYHERSIAYKQCTENRLIAFTSNGQQFYYSLKKYGIWKPVADIECTKILSFKVTHHSSFGIPTVLASNAEYILIIQDCPNEGQKMFKMIPSGYVECIFKKASSVHHEKKDLKI